MKKLLALLLAVLMLAAGANALADAGSEPDWTEYNALIAQIKAETDFAHREELMHQAEDILMGTGALVPIYYYNDLFMKKEGIEGFYSNLYGTKFFMHTTYGDKTTLRIQLASEPDHLDPALNSSVTALASRRTASAASTPMTPTASSRRTSRRAMRPPRTA